MANTIRKLDWLWEVFSVGEIYMILAVVSPVAKLEVGRHELEGQQREGVGGLHAGSHQDLPKVGAGGRIREGSGKLLNLQPS